MPWWFMTDSILLNNRYILEKPLGKGGMATVYRARDQMLERTIAIKLLREDYSSDQDFRARFHQEAKAAANLVHPNIVTVHDFGMDAGRLYIVMEYVPGSDLNTLLQKRGRFTVDEALPLIQQACAGLGYAHRAGLIHCDVKPHNFIITPDNRLKVTDFGIARALETILGAENEQVVWGSPQYFSPEQASGLPTTPASDVYSLGVVVFYMLTGRLPFTASTASEMVQLHRYAASPKPSLFNPSIPPELEEILLKILSKEPSQRYRTADQLGRVLIGLRESQLPVSDKIGINRPGISSEPNPSYRIEDKNPNHYKPFKSGENQTVLTPSGQNVSPARTQVTPVQPAPLRGSSLPNSYTDRKKGYWQKKSSTGSNPLDIDWITMGIGLLTLIALGGLIPFWIWVYYTLR
jgi:eukaryotic-like serine/threonine-protein kinase